MFFLKRSLWVQNLQMLLQKLFDPLFCCSDLDEAVCTSHWSSREVNVQPVSQSQVLSSAFMFSSDLNSDQIVNCGCRCSRYCKTYFRMLSLMLQIQMIYFGLNLQPLVLPVKSHGCLDCNQLKKEYIKSVKTVPLYILTQFESFVFFSQFIFALAHMI